MLPSHFHFQLSYYQNFSIYHIFHIFHCLDRFSSFFFPISSLPASPRYFFQSVSNCLPCPVVIKFSQFVASYFTRTFFARCPIPSFPLFLTVSTLSFSNFLRIYIVFSLFDATYFTHVMYTNCQISNFLVCFFFVSPFSGSILLGILPILGIPFKMLSFPNSPLILKSFHFIFHLPYLLLVSRRRVFLALSSVTFPYKVVIKNHSVTIEGNLILFNCSQGFTQKFGISQPS